MYVLLLAVHCCFFPSVACSLGRLSALCSFDVCVYVCVYVCMSVSECLCVRCWVVVVVEEEDEKKGQSVYNVAMQLL